ncbi:MAG: hypothetical protein V1792_07545 [Pseudomonadota bacterium]
MIGKIITSTWFALLIMAVAATGLFLVYMKGRTLEAAVGGGILAVAALLILLGRERKDPNRDY